MARFHLNVRNGLGFIPDEEGQDLPDLDAARKSAVESVRSIIADEAHYGQIDLAGVIEIADDAGKVLDTLPFSAAFELHLTRDS